ncbi:hypothetical protein PoB_006688600 [Plakobranchus ocellatus]|uniref:Uncharacterized protein n=1 Tax=Plakobranchus ocellatus TaxID=259542 RepID=A0AAV4D8X0_9GAST|nr:hypothetical protein PoB_006688600 [Plakobranchus ocellatus]
MFVLIVCLPLNPQVDNRKPNLNIEFHDKPLLHFGRIVVFKCSACLTRSVDDSSTTVSIALTTSAASRAPLKLLLQLLLPTV